MHLIAIAWMYVVLMMAVAEALSSQGTLLGAFFTVLLYGLLPLSILLYILGTPSRRRALKAAEARATAALESVPESMPAASLPAAALQQADGRSMAPGDAVAPVRKEV